MVDIPLRSFHCELHAAFGADRRAPVGFYVGYQASNSDVDGLHERPWASDKANALCEADVAEGASGGSRLNPRRGPHPSGGGRDPYSERTGREGGAPSVVRGGGNVPHAWDGESYHRR